MSRLKSRSIAQEFVNQYLRSHPCELCGETDIRVLTFDHYLGVKKMNIGDLVTQGYSINTIKEEINKCAVLCFNCHMRSEAIKRKQ